VLRARRHFGRGATAGAVERPANQNLVPSLFSRALTNGDAASSHFVGRSPGSLAILCKCRTPSRGRHLNRSGWRGGAFRPPLQHQPSYSVSRWTLLIRSRSPQIPGPRQKSGVLPNANPGRVSCERARCATRLFPQGYSDALFVNWRQLVVWASRLHRRCSIIYNRRSAPMKTHKFVLVSGARARYGWPAAQGRLVRAGAERAAAGTRHFLIPLTSRRRPLGIVSSRVLSTSWLLFGFLRRRRLKGLLFSVRFMWATAHGIVGVDSGSIRPC